MTTNDHSEEPTRPHRGTTEIFLKQVLPVLAAALIIGIVTVVINNWRTLAVLETRVANLEERLREQKADIQDIIKQGVELNDQIRSINQSLQAIPHFGVDKSRSGRPFDFHEWASRFPDGHVMIDILIDSAGAVVAHPASSLLPGQAMATKEVIDCVRSWVYEGGCRKGVLTVEIDARRRSITCYDSLLVPTASCQNKVIRKGPLLWLGSDRGLTVRCPGAP
jgi:hypothetical protein